MVTSMFATTSGGADDDPRSSSLELLDLADLEHSTGIDLPREVVQEVIRPLIEPLAHQVARDVAGALDVDDGEGAVVAHHVGAAIRLALRQFVAMADTGRDDLDVGPFRELGRKQALSGRSREELLAVYRMGSRSMWRRMVELCVDQGLDTEVLLPIGEAIFAFTDAMSQAALAGYDAGIEDAATTRGARRLELLRRLLAQEGGPLDDALVRQAEQVGWPLPAHVSVVVATAPEGTRTPSFPPQVLAGLLGDRLVAVVADAQAQDLGWLGQRWIARSLVALGPRVTLEAVRTSRDRAHRLLEMHLAQAPGACGVLSVEDHTVDLLLQGEPELVSQLVRSRLGDLLRLPPRRRDPLLETLAAWLRRPGQLSAIADDLHVHAQTVRYRVERLREVLGPQLDDPERRVQLALATRAVERGLSLGEPDLAED